jgi:hypothetical protein
VTYPSLRLGAPPPLPRSLLLLVSREALPGFQQPVLAERVDRDRGGSAGSLVPGCPNLLAAPPSGYLSELPFLRALPGLERLGEVSWPGARRAPETFTLARTRSSRLPARIEVTPQERWRLVKFGAKALREVVTIVHPTTFLR